MKTYTLKDLEPFKPCYDPKTKVPADWSGTLLDVLSLENVPERERIWVVTRFLDDKTNRLFAVWCAREVLKLVTNPDPRSKAACDVAEKYANGEATLAELRAAYYAAYAAYTAAAYTAAAYAAYDADAAYAAYAADAVAAYAAYAAYDADAAYAAYDADAAYAAYAAATPAAATRKKQIEKLREMIFENENN